MVYRIAIATLYGSTSSFLCQELKTILGPSHPISLYNFEDGSIEGGITSDLILIPDHSIFERVKQYARGGQEILVLRRTLHREGFNRLFQLKEGTKAMLVNVTAGMALETISLIYQLGVRHIELTPVYPGIESIPALKIAITPGELEYTPKGVERVIDIGNRILDISSIMDIIVKLRLNHLLEGPSLSKYLKKMVPVSIGLEKIMGRSHQLEGQLEMVLNLLEVGIISVNSLGSIISFNESASRIFRTSKDEVLGFKAQEIFPTIPFSQVLETTQPIKERLIRVKGLDIVLTANPVFYHNTLYGALAVLKRFSDVEKKQHELRSQLINKGHVARYSFNHLFGQSDAMVRCKEIAKRMAESKSTILIMGESGTGKELFAQAIHNHSNRRDYQFVAVNCAAVPESLLESELFGYEKGAFTGARKEGKPGLFELAHKGTLFLDEIGEMPLKLQARLLRVLEEREVMRIGGDRIILVDVRIIAATNSNLKERVREGAFRQDLYYRLHILPLKIPPLRQRREDILLLIEELKKEYHTNFQLTEAVEEVFLKHSFEGNVRELRNYVEYLANLGKGVIHLEDLPFTLEEERRETEEIEGESRGLLEEISHLSSRGTREVLFLLEELERRYSLRKRAGRRSLAEAAKRDGLYLSEQEIRSICSILEEYKLVLVGRGGQGTQITSYGRNLLKGVQSPKG